MKFVSPQYLWICLLALIPWLIYLFQYLLAKSEKLPSLIYIQENKKLKQNPRRKLLVYLLQSMVLLVPGLIMAAPISSFANDKFFCIVDDLLHSQLSKNKLEQVKGQLSGPCQRKFYSLASLSQNKLAQVETNNLRRNEVVFLQNTLLHWQDSINEEQILLIGPKGNYQKGLEKSLDKKLLVYLLDTEDKKNLYFQAASLLPHPTDFRRRELFLKLNMPEGANSQFVIQREKAKISALTDENGVYRQSISVNLEKANETIAILIQGDRFIHDNQVNFMIQSQRPFVYHELPSGLPYSVRAALEINPKHFPFLWFQKRANGPYSIGFSSDLKSSQISFIKSGLNKGPKNLAVNEFGGSHSAFSKLYVRDTYESLYAYSADIALRYSDGTPAVLKEKNAGGIFLFNPDSADERLLKNPAYPLALLQTMINLLGKERTQVLDSETKRNFVLPEQADRPFKAGIIEKGKVTYQLKYHPQASALSGEKFEKSMVYLVEQGGTSFNAETILLLLMFLLLIILLLIDTRVNDINMFRWLKSNMQRS